MTAETSGANRLTIGAHTALTVNAAEKTFRLFLLPVILSILNSPTLKMRLPPSEICDLILSGRIPPIKRNSCPNRVEGDNCQAFTNYVFGTRLSLLHYFIQRTKHQQYSILSVVDYLNKYKNCVYNSGINFVKLLPLIRKFR